MRRRTHALTLALAATAAAVPLALHLRGSSGPAPAASASAAPAAPRALARARAGLVPRAHYRLHYEQAVTAPGAPPSAIRADGEWITTPRADGRTEVRFAPSTLDGPPGALPDAGALAAAAQLVREDGVLRAIGFPEAMPIAARRLVTGLATALQYTDGAGASWAAVEEDPTGRYDAAYRRAGDTVERSRARYRHVRTAAGLSPAPDGATAAERTAFQLDADGVVSAAMALDVALPVATGHAPVALALRAHLERTAIELVAPPDDDALPAAPISGFADFEGARRNADASLVAGASVDELIAEVARTAALGASGGAARAQVLARLAALIRLDPEAAEAVAAQIRQHPDDVAAVRVLAGALASTRIAAGTNALAGLLAGELPEAARGVAVGALSFANPVTPASLQALSAGLDQPHGDQAALGLGTHSRKARDRDPVAADGAVALLLQRQAGAGSGGERRILVEALGNAGSPTALPALRAALAGGDRQLAAAATFSLRFVPGADADALIEQSLARPELALAAVRAAGFRDPARWRALLAAARQQYPGHDGIQGEIRAILRRWG